MRAQIKKVNQQYKAKANTNCTHVDFKPGDLVLSYLTKEKFSLLTPSLYKVLMITNTNVMVHILMCC